jgi:cytochrome P450
MSSNEPDNHASRCPYAVATYDALSPEELRDPYPSYRSFRERSPVFYDERTHLWTVAREQDVAAVLKDNVNFSNAFALPWFDPPEEIRDRVPEFPWVGSVLLLDDPDHRPERKIVQAPFTPRNVNARSEMIRSLTEQLFEPLQRTGSLEFVKEFSYPLSLGVIADILGIPAERFHLLERGVEAAFLMRGSGLTSREALVDACLQFADLYDYIAELVEQRKVNPGDDYISIMTQVPLEDGSLNTTAKGVKRAWTLIGAGFETTANQLADGFRTLLDHRDQWNLLLSDRELVDNAVEEMLRYSSLMKRILRRARTDVVVGGVEIPAGADIALLVGSANRDQAAYDDPHVFDVTRRREHLTFGKWKHFCVGAPLARLEIKIVLETLLERFPDVRLAPEQEPTWRPDIRIQAMSELHLERAAVVTAGTAAD